MEQQDGAPQNPENAAGLIREMEKLRRELEEYKSAMGQARNVIGATRWLMIMLEGSSFRDHPRVVVVRNAFEAAELEL